MSGILGVDFEAKPMLVFANCHLPDPTLLDNDTLLELIIDKLDEFVENDYTVVFFASSAAHQPGWSWLRKAYNRLGRKYKKNLKNVYIVHPSKWIKLLMSVFTAIVSPKFHRKLVWVETLSQLAEFIPIDQIDIPQPVYDFNQRLEGDFAVKKQSSGVNSYQNRVFGVPLTILMGKDGEKGEPKVLTDCIQYILEDGLEVEGIFRRSPSSQQLLEAKRVYDREETVCIVDYGVHVAAVLLKVFLLELPTPVFPPTMYEAIRAFGQCRSDGDRVHYVQRRLLSQFRPPLLMVLKRIFGLLNTVALHCDKNLMNAYNLAIVWSPNLVRSGNPLLDASLCLVSGISMGGTPSPGQGSQGTVGAIVKFCIEQYEPIFNSIQIPTSAQGAPPSLPTRPAMPKPRESKLLPPVNKSVSAPTHTSSQSSSFTRHSSDVSPKPLQGPITSSDVDDGGDWSTQQLDSDPEDDKPASDGDGFMPSRVSNLVKKFDS